MTICIIEGLKISDSDIVNQDEFIPQGEYNPHDVRLFVIHDHGFVVGAAFASCLQDALDELADFSEDFHDKYVITNDELADYGETQDGHFDGISYLGNADEPFDIESIGVLVVLNPSKLMAKGN